MQLQHVSEEIWKQFSTADFLSQCYDLNMPFKQERHIGNEMSEEKESSKKVHKSFQQETVCMQKY